MAMLEISAERCKSCGFCIQVCPRKALALGEKINSKGYHYVVLDKPEQCVMCMMCAQMCPDVAITAEGGE